MEPAESIVRLGFNRWYERQLIESHAHLVTGFLCLIVILASLEDFSLRAPGFNLLVMRALIIGAGLVCYFSCMRFFTMLASPSTSPANRPARNAAPMLRSP